MRILLVSQTYAPDANGQSVFTTRLAQGLANHADDHVGVLLPADGLRSERRTEEGVAFYRIKALAFKPWYPEVRLALATSHQVMAVLQDFHPDIVHLQDHYPLSWLAFRAARRLQIPVIGANHFLPENISRNLPIPDFARNLAIYLLWQTWRITYDQLDLLTTPTPTAAAILRSQGVRPPVLPVSCGIDLSRFYPRPHLNRRAWRRKYGLASESPLFIFVGRVDHEKRLDVLLRAASLLPEHDFQVVIVGKGLHLKPLRHLRQRLGLENKIVFTGYVPDDDLPFVLNSADIFVMPSEAELQSIATLEAMASGLPVLAADKYALPELVRDGVNGYLFPPGNAQALAQKMKELLNHPEHWSAMGKTGRQAATRHDLAETIAAYQKIYHLIIAGHRSIQQPDHGIISQVSLLHHE